MSIKSGELIHVADQLLIDRAQTAGPSALNQAQDRVYELGNYETVGIVRDIPDLTFGVESLDTSAAFESLLVGGDYVADPAGTLYDLGRAQVLDVVGQFKRGRQAVDPLRFDTVGSVATPNLTLESLGYRFGMRDNANQTASLKSDCIYYAEGSGYIQECTGAEAKAGVDLDHDAIPYNGDLVAGRRYVLNVRVKGGRRLRFGVDYTETPGAGTGAKAVTVEVTATDVADTDTLSITYQSPVIQNFPQNRHTPDGLIKPAAIRGKDITVFLAPQSETDIFVAADRALGKATPKLPSYYLTGVQSATVDWRVTLQNDEEFGNSQYVGQDFDVPAVNGNVEIKPVNIHDLMARVKQVAGLDPNAVEVVGPYQVVSLQLAVVLHSPIDGHVLKTLYTPDARFTLPANQLRVEQKATYTFNWESVSSALYAAKGVFDPAELP
jgi:hypothetical protein